jgi:hypothetical protein
VNNGAQSQKQVCLSDALKNALGIAATSFDKVRKRIVSVKLEPTISLEKCWRVGAKNDESGVVSPVVSFVYGNGVVSL